MGRVIKFRGWDGSRMRSWDDIKDTLGFHWWIFDTPEGVELMQFSGLHDKDGNEIYDKDRVTWRWSAGLADYQVSGTGTITWDKSGWVVNADNGSLGSIGIESLSQFGQVIGNIYQNEGITK